MSQNAETGRDDGESGATTDSGANRAEVQRLFQQMARDLTAGAGSKVAALWEAPALVISDQGVHAVATSKEIEDFFSGAKEQYNKLGITDTRPEIQRLTWPTSRVAIVEVRWPWLTASGQQSGSESSTYTLRRDDAGRLRVRSVVMHGVARND